MFSLAHFFLRCCHTFFTSALGLLPWTSTLQEWCKSEKFWKFQILIKFKFKLNIIFSEKIWKIQKKSENFRFSEKKMKNSEKIRKFQIFRKNMKNSEKFWTFQIFRKNLEKKNIKNRKISDFQKIWKIQKKIESFRFSEKIWKSDFHKKSEKFRKNLKISDFQKKMKIQRKSENFRFSETKNLKNSEQIWNFQILRKNLKKSEKIWKCQKKIRKNLKISDFQKTIWKKNKFSEKKNLKTSIRIWKSYFKKHIYQKKWKIKKKYKYIIFINKSNLPKKITNYFNASEYWE